MIQRIQILPNHLNMFHVYTRGQADDKERQRCSVPHFRSGTERLLPDRVTDFH